MGCSMSGPQNAVVAHSHRKSMSSNPLTQKEILQRLEGSDHAELLNIGGYKIRYAFLSQRGYYPDSPDKANQDAFCVETNFAGNANQAFFAVFDGHGKEGHHCAQFAKKHLAVQVGQRLGKGEDFELALSTAHRLTNQMLHAQSNVDDNLSGTTAISVFVDGNSLYISNVGDSRAIIGVQEGGRIVSKPLSCDQTPYRKDERERVKKYGARVLSMDQIEGLEPVHENWGDVKLGEEIDEGGDPPRIWSPHGEYPGTAFTRSIGDAIAEELGVTADPEILHRELGPNDRFVVIASDGVFEFLTNQMVADMVASRPDPMEACRAVVAEAYELWLQYEIRTDDITMIALYLEGLGEGNGDVAPAPRSVFEEMSMSETKPVRRAMSRAVRKTLIIDTPAEEEEGELPVSSPKTAEELEKLDTAIRTNFLFQHLNDEQRQHIFNYMQKVVVQPGMCVIRQGDRGDRFYVVDSGRFYVRVQRPGENREDGGEVVHTYTSENGTHPSFGELSLMYGKPRAASVIASTEGVLWALDRSVFKKVLMESRPSRRDVLRTLRKVQILTCLSVPQLQRLADVMSEITFQKDQHVVHQGDLADSLFIIRRGTCVQTDSQGNVVELKENAYFGDKGLCNEKDVHLSDIVVSSNSVTVLTISQRAFEEALGPLRRLMDDSRVHRESRVGIIRPPENIDEIKKAGIAQEDELGQVITCIYGASNPNLMLRGFMKSAVDEMKLQSLLSNYLDVARVVANSPIAVDCEIVPRLLHTYKERNGVFMLFKSPVVADLGSLLADGTWNEDHIKNAAAHICVGLGILHQMGVVYRGLSSDLVYLDAEGNLVLCDYRVSKLGTERTYTLTGHSEYLSPEQVTQQGHNMAADFWGLGVLMYEMRFGKTPFQSDSEMETYNNITSHQRDSPIFPAGNEISAEFEDAVRSLLDPNQQTRLGCRSKKGIDEIKTHAFFRGIDWTGLENGTCPVMPLRSLAQSTLENVYEHEFDVSVFQNVYKTNSSVFEGF